MTQNVGFYSSLFNLLREMTIRTVESIPPQQIDYRPQRSRSFAEIVLHVVESQYHILNGVTGAVSQPEKELTTSNYPTQESLVALLRAEQKNALEVLDTLDEAALSKIVKGPLGDDAAAEAYLTILLVHETDHKGNLVMMAKTIGADPPDVARVRKEMTAAS